MKRVITFLYLISGSLLTFMLWWLQEKKIHLPADSFIALNEVNIGCIVFSISMIISLSYCYIYYISDKLILDKWVHMLLKHILDQYLANDNYETRLTVFKPKVGWKTWGYYFLHVILGDLFDNCSYDKFCLSICNFPLHARTVYLQQTDRVTSCRNPRSMTIFRTSVRGLSYNGIADICFREDRDQCFAQTEIVLDNDKIPSKYPEGADVISKSIRTYMSEMCIGKEFYNTFRGISFKTKQVFAFPLRLPDDSIWGIVVIDSDDNLGQSLKEILNDHIGDYQVMFRSMCKSLKRI